MFTHPSMQLFGYNFIWFFVVILFLLLWVLTTNCWVIEQNMHLYCYVLLLSWWPNVLVSFIPQTALTLAVAERKFDFEHRDLHWGNLLIRPTTEKYTEFHVDGKVVKLLTHGVKATIIDYSLSRMVYDGAVLYDNLARDEELFQSSGDYQFDIYRLMRERVE